MRQINRRAFLGKSGKAMMAAGLGFSGSARGANRSAITPRGSLVAHDTIRIGVIGLKGRGQRHIEELTRTDGAEVVAVCDVDQSVLNQRAKELEAAGNRRVDRHLDLRHMLDDQSIDAVTIATPNHWHTLAAIWAMEAGKDVYVEKPLSHTVWEGRQLVKAARKYKKMCQHGTQGRVAPMIVEAVRRLREGVIGKVYLARGLCYKWRPSIGHTPDEPVPEGVNYNLWLGPAPKRAFSRNRFHYNWHWFWDYGGGDIGNQGVHEMDLCRWGLGVGLPDRVQSMGGRFLFDDDKEVPNVQTACFHYSRENKMLEFEVRPAITNHEGQFGEGASDNIGCIFYGSDGYMTVNYLGYATFLGKNREPGPNAETSRDGQTGKDFCWKRWLVGLRSRRINDLAVDVEDGHLSSALCHLANISYRLGRSLSFDPQTEAFVRDEQANQMLTRAYRTPFVVPGIA